MTQANEVVTAIGGNLDNRSLFVPLASLKNKTVEANKIALRIISKEKEVDGKKTKDLPESLALVIPANLAPVSECNKYPALSQVMADAIQDLQVKYCKSRAIVGDTGISHVDLHPANLEAFAVASNETLGRLTLAEIAAIVKDNWEVIKASYETATEKTVPADKEAQAQNFCRGILEKLCESKPMLANEKQEIFAALVAESITGEIRSKLAAKVEKAVAERAAMLAAAEDLGM